jgi:hypothetical protein
MILFLWQGFYALVTVWYFMSAACIYCPLSTGCDNVWIWGQNSQSINVPTMTFPLLLLIFHDCGNPKFTVDMNCFRFSEFNRCMPKIACIYVKNGRNFTLNIAFWWIPCNNLWTVLFNYIDDNHWQESWILGTIWHQNQVSISNSF